MIFHETSRKHCLADSQGALLKIEKRLELVEGGGAENEKQMRREGLACLRNNHRGWRGRPKALLPGHFAGAAARKITPNPWKTYLAADRTSCSKATAKNG